MKWDAVEREFMILSTQLAALARTFRVLAGELSRERECVKVVPIATREGDAPQKEERGAEPPLPFS